ncbi:MAG: SpoIIE family protein phosphatase [Isosphaeraceae bacterium]
MRPDSAPHPAFEDPSMYAREFAFPDSGPSGDEQDTGEFVTFEELVSRFFEDEPRKVALVNFAARTDPGKVRPNNEDNYAVTRRLRSRDVLATSLAHELFPANHQVGYAFTVADGMGGQQFGEIASLLALRTGWDLGGGEIKWTLKVNRREIEEFKEKARLMFQLIHRTIRAEAQANPRLHGMGTTLTIAYTVGPHLFVIHAGDSRAYRFRQGKLERLTRDHSLAQTLIDAGQIEAGSPEERKVRHVLTNSLGAHYSTVDVDVNHERLATGDRLLLCTDGLTDMVDDGAIAETLGRHKDPQAACDDLLRQALDRGGRDNITLIIADFRFEDPAEGLLH